MVQSHGSSSLDGYDFQRIKAFTDQYYNSILTGIPDGDVIIWDGVNDEFTSISRYDLFPKFSAYRHTGTQSITTTAISLIYDTEVVKDSIYTHTTGAAGVTVTEAGLYQVHADLSTTTTAGSTASYVTAFLAIGTTEIEGTRTFINATTPRASVSINARVSLAANDTLNVRAILSTSGNTVTTIADSTRLGISKVDVTTSAVSGHAMGAGIFSYITYP